MLIDEPNTYIYLCWHIFYQKEVTTFWIGFHDILDANLICYYNLAQLHPSQGLPNLQWGDPSWTFPFNV